MTNKKFAFNYIVIITGIAIVFSACKKLNESTELGGDLIPPVDNITTFDTTINVLAFNDTFSVYNGTDSTRLGPTAEYFLGKIQSDPFFGKTDARLFLELKPLTYPHTFLNKPDSLFIDSIVLVLDHVENYGDTLTPQTVNVYEMDRLSPFNNFKYDSNFLIRRNDFEYFNLLGSRTFLPTVLKDSVKAYKDTTKSQLRIRLNDAFGQRLLNYDTTNNFTTGAYRNDTTFVGKFRGFALQSTAGNALMGFNLAGANTKLAIYYRYYNKFPNVDTTVFYFGFYQNLTQKYGTASANYVIRDYAGTPLMSSLMNPATTPDDELYIQNTPGTFARIKIPDMATVSNRVIHRAELVVEQLYDIQDSMFRTPDYLYLDAFDPTIATDPKLRTVPYDLAFNSSGSLSLSTFGCIPIIKTDAGGNRIKTWKFNISRYIQHYLTRQLPLYDLRLSAPVFLIEKFGIPPGADITTTVSVNPSIAKGRVRLGGTNHPTQKIKLRLIYSKL